MFITEFVLSRIDEEEDQARQDFHKHREHVTDVNHRPPPEGSIRAWALERTEMYVRSRLIELEQLRRITELCQVWVEGPRSVENLGRISLAQSVMHAIALRWETHPGFDVAWPR